ncbi:dimethylargininase [Ilumatobacter sp.]|uniref:dimethylargininase n=1 Tax=Ilumatobacter sp. TaxID=1967498 RepID=UPI003B51C33A
MDLPASPPTTRRAVVRRPSPRLAEGEVSTTVREPVDADRAREQWEGYVEAMRSRGWEIFELEPADDHPDGVFVEDAVFVHGELAVVTRPGARSRRGETEGLAHRFAQLGFEVAAIEAPATLDGGDLLDLGGTVYAGRSARTDAAGIDQLRALLAPAGSEVVEVPVTAALHLKSCLTALPDGTVVGWRPFVDRPDLFASIRMVPEESGAHVVDLGDGRILVAASCPRSADEYASLGYEVVAVEIGEFEKLDGCVTCLSVRLHDGID